MTATLQSPPEVDVGPTLQELLDRVGDLPLRRIRLHPYPATEQDVLEIDAQEKRLCELVDGVLVEKPMGALESHIAAILIELLGGFVRKNKLGVVLAPDGMMRIAPGRVRMPDVSFIEWRQFPGGKMSPTPIPSIYPDLAVEVLSISNTRNEMEKKRSEYFAAGTRLVWIVDPSSRTVSVFTPEKPNEPTVFSEPQTVVGDPVLPGFSFVVGQLFEDLK
jgi:Uma2 family endonuclease